MLEVETDAIEAMISIARKVEQENLRPVMQMARAAMQALHHALEFIKCVGLVFDYLFVDSYRYEQLFQQFVESPSMLETVVQMVAAHQKFNLIARCYSKNKAAATSHVPLVFCKVLFKMLTHQSGAAKNLFLQS